MFNRNPKLKRLLWGAGALLLTLVVALLVLWGLFEREFHTGPRPPAFPAPQSAAEGVRQDLEYVAELLNVDKSFSAAARERFERDRQALIARAKSLTPQALEMAVSQLVALAGNGHTTVYRRTRRMGRLPIRTAWFEEGLFVVRATGEHTDLLGAQVVRINGKTPDELATGMQPYLSGSVDHVRAASPLFLELPALLAGIWPDMPTDRARIVVRNEAGREQEIEIVARQAEPNTAPMDIERVWAPQRAAGESNDWRALLIDNDRLPLSLQYPDDSVHYWRLDQGKGLYLNLRAVMDDKNGALGDQLDAALRDIPSGGLRYAILDLRTNGGGDYTKSLGFTKALPARIADDGKLFMLTGGGTFSAAIVTLARTKYFAGKRAVVIGERVGDGEQFWAEGAAPLVLPNSQIYIGYATGYHDWANGCRGRERCYWTNLLFDVPAGSLSPDYVVKWRFADYRANRDTVLEAALAKARAPSRGRAATSAAMTGPRRLLQTASH